MSLEPGFFRLYPYAQPPLGIGRYVVQGDVSIPGGSFEQLNAAVDVIGPRYQLPPDQVLSTYPPSGSRGAYSRRLPQIVVRRRTLPWEWSTFVEGDTPTPWLALVLIAPGEGTVKVDRPVAECVTPGTELSDPDIADTPKGSYLEVPQSVVTKTFPTAVELSHLVHVREVDLADTELAAGDDDGWLSVVLCNRLPQDGVTYTACLINVEGQTHRLPVDPDFEAEFDVAVPVFDVSAYTTYLAGDGVPASRDAVTMGDTEVAMTGFAQNTAAHSSKSAGIAWAAGTTMDAASTVSVDATGGQAVADHSALLGIFDLPYAVLSPTYRFPVLTSWSFTCEGDGDFATLANRVTSRLLGYVQDGPEDPDGGPTASPPAPTLTEPPAHRPLPLVTESGHVVAPYRSRVGDDAQAYFRGPFTPYPTVRPTPDDPDRVVIAHHSDQLRRVVPDGMQDLTYAAAFEIGRLLALSRPGVVALLSQWRRQRFAAAAAVAAHDHVLAHLPDKVKQHVELPDPLRREVRVLPEDLPGPKPDELIAPLSGRQFVRGILSMLGETDVAGRLPDASPGFARDDAATLSRDRARRLAKGLAIDADLTMDAADLAVRLATMPVAHADNDHDADLALARAVLEDTAGTLAAAAEQLQQGEIFRRLR